MRNIVLKINWMGPADHQEEVIKKIEAQLSYSNNGTANYCQDLSLLKGLKFFPEKGFNSPFVLETYNPTDMGNIYKLLNDMQCWNWPNSCNAKYDFVQICHSRGEWYVSYINQTLWLDDANGDVSTWSSTTKYDIIESLKKFENKSLTYGEWRSKNFNPLVEVKAKK